MVRPDCPGQGPFSINPAETLATSAPGRGPNGEDRPNANAGVIVWLCIAVGRVQPGQDRAFGLRRSRTCCQMYGTRSKLGPPEAGAPGLVSFYAITEQTQERAVTSDPTDSAQVNGDLYQNVRVVLGIIVGLAIARLLYGIARIIQHPGRDRLPWIHLGWVAWTLLNVLAFWWWEFRLSRVAHCDLWASYCSSMFAYATAVLPAGGHDPCSRTAPKTHAGYEDLFIARRGWFFGLVALTLLMDVPDTWIKGAEHLQSLGPAYLIRIGGLVIMCVIAARTRNLLFHRIFAAAALVYEAGFIAYYLRDVA